MSDIGSHDDMLWFCGRGVSLLPRVIVLLTVAFCSLIAHVVPLHIALYPEVATVRLRTFHRKRGVCLVGLSTDCAVGIG